MWRGWKCVKRTAMHLGLPPSALAFEPAAPGGGARLRGASGLWAVHGPDEQLPQPLDGGPPVGLLRAAGLCDDVQFILLRKAMAGQLPQSIKGIRPEPPQGTDGDPHFRLGVELVDILPAGAAAPGVLKTDRARRGKDPWSDLQAHIAFEAHWMQFAHRSNPCVVAG